jgi:phosphoribosyl-ATP pyrophosphohydrolase
MDKGMELLYNVIKERKQEPAENSYTCYLFQEGINKILKKCGEECSEVIIAAKDNDDEQLKEEICDLLYHILVLMAERNIELSEIQTILAKRRQKIGNKKAKCFSDPNT